MQSKTYEMGKDGKLVELVSHFDNLQPGAVIQWGGNAGFAVTDYCILSRLPAGDYSDVRYECFDMDHPEHNAMLQRVEARSIKSADDPSVWHSQHFFIQPDTVDPETVEKYRAMHQEQCKAKENHEAELKAEADKLEALGRELWPSLIGNCPAVIIAELEQDVSDSQTDYFASQTVKRVILAPSAHKRDLFPEMRKAAELLPETAHLGIGKNRYTPYVEIGKDFISNGACYHQGSRSHWHPELEHNEQGDSVVFTTMPEAQAFIAQKGDPEPVSFDGDVVPFAWNIQEESIERREKYSMGKGYYLATGSYSGWQVSKHVFYNSGPSREDYICLAKCHDHLVKSTPKADTKPEQPKENAAYTVNYDRDWTWIKFAAKPAESVLSALKNAGARFSSKRVAWYFTRHIEAAELGL